MTYDAEDTIVARASASGPAERAIVRLAGNDWIRCLGRFQPDSVALKQLQRPTRLTGTWQIDEHAGRRLPCSIYAWPTDRSYTGQPTVELHTLGSPPIVERIIRQICDEGARPARAGEFTQRAFLAGRIDLTQAEAVLGVIDAENRGQLETALDQLSGGLSQPLSDLRSRLLNLCADIEAGLDFVDEDIEFVTTEVVLQTLDDAIARLATTAQQLQLRRRNDARPRITLVGRPNAGKSTLWNALQQRSTGLHATTGSNSAAQAAIVSDTPGTTRDYLVAVFQLGNREVELVDTAGIDRRLDSGIDQAAQEVATATADRADLVVLCKEAGGAETLGSAPTVVPAEESLDSSLDDSGAPDPDLIVWTKLDLIPRTQAMLQTDSDVPEVAVSVQDKTGLSELVATLTLLLDRQGAAATDSVTATAIRCQAALQNSLEATERARALAAVGDGHELIADELRRSLSGLAEVVGAIYTDDILDRVFQRFCIGK